MKIMQYVPKRDSDGKFVSKKKLAKIVFLLFVALNFYASVRMSSMIWNLRCGVDGKVVGWMVKDTTCDQFAQSKMNELEVARLQFVASNQDIFQ